jgi:hypothetical protein
MPKIPPRPTNRRHGRSISPNLDSFARSPLNEAPLAFTLGNNSLPNLSQNALTADVPPNLTLPSIGQEGSEYANIFENGDTKPSESQSQPEERNIGSDLKLHAPKPSLPSSAKAGVTTVTRTDSDHAATAGDGKARSTPGDDNDPHSRPLRTKTSFASNISIERPSSTQPGESGYGIPEIGQRVPMYPNAGDVQAPSPSPYQQSFAPGIGFQNDGPGRPGRHHGRTRSGRGFDNPPGSYGLHGHGVTSESKFEKAWYEKHPDMLEKEQGEYGPGIGGRGRKGEWVLTSDELNKLVKDTPSRAVGTGQLKKSRDSIVSNHIANS